jgi:ABC-type uncharacterized transport system involved in gliding motility auxiliary subunit
MKPGSKTLAVVLLFVALVLVNYLASSLPVRFDATAESIYSLSPGTKAMLGKIEEPVTLDLYFSKDAAGLPIAYKNYAVRVEEMLRQYVRASGGKLTLNVVYLRPDTPEEEKATSAGLTPQMARTGGDQFFFGLIVTQADQQKTIPAFAPDREQFLEYDLSKLIHSAQQFDKRKLGLLTSLPLQGTSPQEMQMMMMMRRQPQPSQYIVTEWEQSFQIVRVEESATTLPDGLDVLVVAHPQNVSPKLQFAIDQFLLSGKPVVLAVDPASLHFKQQAGQQQQMMGGPAPNVSSDLPTLLNAYGIGYDGQKVVGDLENPLPVPGPNNSRVRMPTYLNLPVASFNREAVVTSQLKTMWLVEAGGISPLPGSALKFTPLIETSSRSGDIAASMLQFAQGDDVAKQITPSGKKTIAALVTGKFKTAFPEGAPKDPPPAAKEGEQPKPAEPAAATGEVLAESKSNSTLFVIADTDWLFDYTTFDPRMRQAGVLYPMNDNYVLAGNIVEYLGGSQDLISIRGKGTSVRPFTVVRQMEAEAEQKYRDKLSELDARLQQVQTKLSELQGKKTEGNRLVATPEVAKAIEDFQKQQAAMQGERRQIRRALREDIDALENRLLLTNLVATPLLILAFGVWFHRARRGA